MLIYKLIKNNIIILIIKLFFLLLLLINYNIYACQFFNDFHNIEKEILKKNNYISIKLLNNLKEKKNKCNLIKLLINLTEKYIISKDYVNSNNIANQIIKLNNKKFINYVLYIKALSNIKLDKSKHKKFFYINKSDKDILNINIAFKCFKKIMQNNDYNYNKLLLDKFNKLKIRLIIYELNIIKFYFKKSLYISVINRSIYIINNFPEFSSCVIPYLKKIKKNINIPNYKFHI